VARRPSRARDEALQRAHERALQRARDEALLYKPFRLAKLPAEPSAYRAARHLYHPTRGQEILDALIRRYRLRRRDRGFWEKLFWETAAEFVPGMTHPIKAGRVRDESMFREVDAMRARGVSMNRATFLVAKKHGQSLSGFRSRYQRWRKNRG
jgi:hypothetical protein